MCARPRAARQLAPKVRAETPWGGTGRGAATCSYLRLGAQVCGQPAHDPDFGVGDFPALLDKRRADTRYLKRLRSVGAAAVAVGESA